MKKNFSAIALLAILTLAACAQQKKTTGTASAQNAGSKTDFSYVQMRRTPCFGRCPSYAIELFKDGTVKYTGVSDTKYTGTYEKKLSADKTATIFKAMQEYRIDTCQAEYRLTISDLPGIVYDFTVNGKKQEIMNAHFGPEFLKSLARDIDSLGGEPGAGWKKIEDMKK